MNQSYGCSSAGDTDLISCKIKGKNVDTRTFKAHSVADGQAAFRVAVKNTETVIDTKIEEITTYLSASVLCRALAAPFGRDPTILRIVYLKRSPLLPQEKPIAASKRAHSQLSTPPLAHITLVLPLCIPQLVKQAQGALEKTVFSHLWLILRWRLTLSTIEP